MSDKRFDEINQHMKHAQEYPYKDVPSDRYLMDMTFLLARLTRLEAAVRYTVRKMHDSTIVYDMDKCCKRLEHALAEPQKEE